MELIRPKDITVNFEKESAIMCFVEKNDGKVVVLYARRDNKAPRLGRRGLRHEGMALAHHFIKNKIGDSKKYITAKLAYSQEEWDKNLDDFEERYKKVTSI